MAAIIRRCADLVPRCAMLVVASRSVGMRMRIGQGLTWAGVPWYVRERLARKRLRSSLARLALVRRRAMLVVASHSMGIRVRRGQGPMCAFFCPLSNA